MGACHTPLLIAHWTACLSEGGHLPRLKVFWFFFSKKNSSARGWGGAAGQAAARSKKKTALLFEKRSKNFCSL
jgi:hypothetical protein